MVFKLLNNSLTTIISFIVKHLPISSLCLTINILTAGFTQVCRAASPLGGAPHIQPGLFQSSESSCSSCGRWLGGCLWEQLEDFSLSFMPSVWQCSSYPLCWGGVGECGRDHSSQIPLLPPPKTPVTASSCCFFIVLVSDLVAHTPPQGDGAVFCFSCPIRPQWSSLEQSGWTSALPLPLLV